MSKLDIDSEDFKLKILRWLGKYGIKDLSLHFDSSIRDTYCRVIKCYTNRNYYIQEKNTVQRPKYDKNIVLLFSKLGWTRTSSNPPCPELSIFCGIPAIGNG